MKRDLPPVFDVPEKEANLELFATVSLNKLILEAKIEGINSMVLEEEKEYHVIKCNCQNYIIDFLKSLNIAHGFKAENDWFQK